MNKTLIALVLSACATLPAFAASNGQKFTVNGMVCAFCAQGIEKRIAKMPATQEVLVDLKKKYVIVEPKDGQALDSAAIAAEIKEAGYDVVKTEPFAQPIAELRGAGKKP